MRDLHQVIMHYASEVVVIHTLPHPLSFPLGQANKYYTHHTPENMGYLHEVIVHDVSEVVGGEAVRLDDDRVSLLRAHVLGDVSVNLIPPRPVLVVQLTTKDRIHYKSIYSRFRG